MNEQDRDLSKASRAGSGHVQTYVNNAAERSGKAGSLLLFEGFEPQELRVVPLVPLRPFSVPN